MKSMLVLPHSLNRKISMQPWQHLTEHDCLNHHECLWTVIDDLTSTTSYKLHKYHFTKDDWKQLAGLKCSLEVSTLFYHVHSHLTCVYSFLTSSLKIFCKDYFYHFWCFLMHLRSWKLAWMQLEMIRLSTRLFISVLIMPSSFLGSTMWNLMTVRSTLLHWVSIY